MGPWVRLACRSTLSSQALESKTQAGWNREVVPATHIPCGLHLEDGRSYQNCTYKTFQGELRHAQRPHCSLHFIRYT